MKRLRTLDEQQIQHDYLAQVAVEAWAERWKLDLKELRLAKVKRWREMLRRMGEECDG